ncbi:MAG TPA: hypothetical protein VLE27_05105, partial [Thermoanaerobaculia bacterium]|nr:hypothetical protein [Thermoanaerobaculia bacterium]
MKIDALRKKHALGVGFVAVLVPLLVLLGLQYRWLVKLDHSSEIVHNATLKTFLEGVTGEVQRYYESSAERTLNLPPSVFTQGQLGKAAGHFKKKGIAGSVRHFFVMSFVQENSKLLFFYPSCESFEPPPWSPEVKAAYVAVIPWKTISHKDGGYLETVRLAVEEKDPNFRILLYPITDDTSKLVGVAGMILDESYFRGTVLHRAIKKALYDQFPDRKRAPVVSIKDGRGDILYATAPIQGKDKDLWDVDASQKFSFVFTDWTIGLKSRHSTPAAVARRNFLVNIGLSAALATALLGGLMLALRTASREMKLSEMKNDFVSNVSHELR